jgi:voltage-gated sodium channel
MYSSIKKLVDASWFQHSIITLIVLNGITMGMETSPTIMATYGSLIDYFNAFVLTVFTIEIALRIYVYRTSFFKDPWSLFDFTIVAIALVPAGEGLEIIRVLRVLRLFRLITVIPQMRKVVSALVAVIPGMLSIAGVLTLFFYVFAIMATQLYAQSFPQWFGSLGESFYTLFQIMTLESWSMGIVRPVMEVHPYAWIFFVPFIFIATFIMVNLIIAIVIDAMSAITQEESEESEDKTIKEIEALRKEIGELKALIESIKP